jgi:hypothetical protein
VDLPAAQNFGVTAFYRCTNLTSLRFPATATIIGSNAVFQGSTSIVFNLIGVADLSVREDGKALVRYGTELVAYPAATGTVILDAIEIIGNNAFAESSLVRVNLPHATAINRQSFQSCTSLESINIPNVTFFGTQAFHSTTSNDFTITLGQTAPTVETILFLSGAHPPITVTVRVPTGATGYGTLPFNNADTTTPNWGNAFRGMGWDPGNAAWAANGGYGNGTVNANINLIIMPY